MRGQVTDEGLIVLSTLPKLQRLTLEDSDKFSVKVFEHFESLKSLELVHCLNTSDTGLVCIANNCLELQSLKIR